MQTPYSVIRREVATSTQDVAREAFASAPVLAIADRQDAGRGRSGSGWQNAPRAVAMSMAFAPAWPRDRWSIVPLVAGVAVVRCVDARLKWPNDVMRGDRKVGGILVEAAGDGPVVAGVGLNVWWPDAPDGFGGLNDTDPGADLADDIARCWADQLLDILGADPDSWPRNEYVGHCVTLGSHIAWEPDGHGLAIDVAPDGALEVETPDGPTTIRSGEVRHVRAG